MGSGIFCNWHTPRFLCPLTMAPHLTPEELDFVASSMVKRLTAKEIWSRLKEGRDSSALTMPKIWAARRAMAGVTHKRGQTQTSRAPVINMGVASTFTQAIYKYECCNLSPGMSSGCSTGAITFASAREKVQPRLCRTFLARWVCPSSSGNASRHW